MKLFGATLIAAAAAQMNSSRATGSKYGQVSDDPHFVVMTSGQEPLCFDFNPANGTEMNLLLDPETNLAISATAHDAVKAGRTFMSSIRFASPNGAHLEFNPDGVHHAGLGELTPTDPHPLTGHQEYGDIFFIEHWYATVL